MNKSFEGFKENKIELEDKILNLLREFERYYDVGVDNVCINSVYPLGDRVKTIAGVSVSLEI